MTQISMILAGCRVRWERKWTRHKREIFPKYSLENISLRIVFFYNRYAISIRISPYELI